MKQGAEPAPRISIAMATYNGAGYLPAQLASLAVQSALPSELVVTDDGSTDATAQIIEDFARFAAFPVKLFRNQTRLMFRDNFLRAAELCTGELIAFCDQDDVWHPDKLLRCAKEFAAPAVALTVHSARIWHGDGDFRGRLPHFRSRRHYEKRGIDPFVTYPGFAIMFRRDLLDITDNFARPDYILPSGGQYQKMAHDQWVFFLASIFGEIVTLPDVLADYRQHDSNTFGATAKPKMSENLRSSITTVSYAGIAQRFSQLADFMRAIARTAPPAHRDAALQAAARFARRAEFNARRDGLYRIDTTLPHRLAAFGKMLADGLYTPDQSSTHPTQGAVLKDLCFAIPGFHKYIVKTRSAEYPARG